MTVVYRYVCDIERKALKFSFLATLQGQNRKKTMKRSRRVMIQGALYSLAMVLLYIFGFLANIVAMITKKYEVNMLLLISFTLTPLQGVFNIAIYLIPVFRDRLKIYRQSKKSNEKEQETKIKVHRRLSTEAYYKRPRSSVIVMGEEDKGEIPVLHRHTSFYPDSDMAEGSGEGDNIHDDHAAIDDDESDRDSSGEDFY